MKPVFKSLVVAGLLATAGFAAFAQGPGGMDHKNTDRMEKMMAKRTDDLKAKLKLTPAQEGAWTAFTAAMKPSHDKMGKHPDRAEMDKLSTPERIEKMRALRTQRMTEMNAAMNKRDEATTTFYATLSAEQKKTFDAEHARMGGRHHGDQGDKRKGAHHGAGAPTAPKQ